MDQVAKAASAAATGANAVALCNLVRALATRPEASRARHRPARANKKAPKKGVRTASVQEGMWHEQQHRDGDSAPGWSSWDRSERDTRDGTAQRHSPRRDEEGSERTHTPLLFTGHGGELGKATTADTCRDCVEASREVPGMDGSQGGSV